MLSKSSQREGTGNTKGKKRRKRSLRTGGLREGISLPSPYFSVRADAKD